MIAFDKNHIPYLTVIIDPTGSHPVVLTLDNDWMKDGEYVLTATPLEVLEIANLAMQHAAMSMADELWDMVEKAKRMSQHYSDEESTS